MNNGLKKIIRGNSCNSWIIIFFIFTSFPLITAQNPTFDSLANEINRLSLYKKTKAIDMLDSLYKIANNSPDSFMFISRCLYEESLLKQRHRIIDTLLIAKIKKHIDEDSLKLQERAVLQSALVLCLMTKGEYSNAFSIQLQAFETHKQFNNNLLKSSSLNVLGIICASIGLLSLSDYYYSEALTYTNPESREYYYTKINIISLISKSNLQVALDSMFLLIEQVEKTNREEILLKLYLNAGLICLETNPEQALSFFERVQSLDFDNSSDISILYAGLGAYYSFKNNYIESLNYFKNAQNFMEKNNDYSNLTILYNDISSIFETENLYDSALIYSRKSHEIAQNLRSNTLAIETHQKLITTLLETSQKDLVIAKQKNELKTRQFIIVLIISISAILVVLLFLRLTNQQKRNKIIENDALKSKIEHDEKVLQLEQKQRKLEKEKQQDMINSKTRELTSYSILVSNKNRIMKRIMTLVTDKGNPADTLSKIENIVKNNLTIDDDWSNFKLHFDKVHPQFFENLKSKSGELTDENMKLCAYIKMKMSTKQIAQLLHVIPETVTVNKCRIKKKLKLSDKDDFDDFIGTM